MRQAKRANRTLSDAERAKLLRLRLQIESEKDEIIAKARRQKAATDVAKAIRDK